jgi:uncharacterized membrane protein
VSYQLAVPLLVDRRLPPWQAMETSRRFILPQWWMWWGFSIFQGLVLFAGFLVCCVGIVFTTPIAYCALALAYEQTVGLASQELDDSHV